VSSWRFARGLERIVDANWEMQRPATIAVENDKLFEFVFDLPVFETFFDGVLRLHTLPGLEDTDKVPDILAEGKLWRPVVTVIKEEPVREATLFVVPCDDTAFRKPVLGVFSAGATKTSDFAFFANFMIHSFGLTRKRFAFKIFYTPGTTPSLSGQPLRGHLLGVDADTESPPFVWNLAHARAALPCRIKRTQRAADHGFLPRILAAADATLRRHSACRTGIESVHLLAAEHLCHVRLLHVSDHCVQERGRVHEVDNQPQPRGDGE
jgi:hypothetical protein